MERYHRRCYQNYVSTHWKFFHSSSKREFDHLRRIYKKRFNDFMPKGKTAKIIDIACGAGHFLYYLQREGYINTCGIDLNKEQLEVAKRIGVKNVKQADLFKFLPNNVENFDVIIANDIIEHLNKSKVLIFLDLIYQSLKPCGKVLISTANAQSLFGANGVFADFTHETGFTPISLAQIMRVCHFKDVKVYGEKPIPYDFVSAIRLILWLVVSKVLKAYITIERGTGRGMRKYEYIFEPRIYAIGEKDEKEN